MCFGLKIPLMAESQMKIKQPVFGADIYIEQLHIGTTSDASGLFQLDNIPNGTHKLSISYVGFNTENLEVTVKFRRYSTGSIVDPFSFPYG